MRLARSGIQHIHDEAIVDARAAAYHFRDALKNHTVVDVSVLGTAALRTADNASSFITDLETILGHPVHLIDGQEEARLIAVGVMPLLSHHPGVHLVLDIGGGSVELILLDQGRIQSSISLPIGMGVLHHQFHIHDPITPGELASMRACIISTVSPWLKRHHSLTVTTLVGASGIFDVLADSGSQSNVLLCQIPFQRIRELTNQVTALDLSGRMHVPGMPEERADLIVSAMHVIDVIIDLAQPGAIFASAYALKEGALMHMMAARGYSSSSEPASEGDPI